MKLIRHIIFSDIGNGTKLMLNSLNGLMDKVDDYIFETISKWQQCDDIIPNGEDEVALLENLKSRGYIVANSAEEAAKKEIILEQLRQKQAKSKANNRHLTFIMTYDCNFRCPYCFETELPHSKKTVMTPELIDAAFDLVGDELQAICLFGGEPILPKNRAALEYIISKAPDKAYAIITNGYYLEEFFDLISKVNISGIMITLDGDEETHNKRRYLANGKPTYSKIMAGIEKCLENDIPICIRMNLDTSNVDNGNHLKTKLLDQFSRYKKLLTFEMTSLVNAPTHEKIKICESLFTADVEFGVEERIQRNRVIGQFSPIVNAITVGAKPAPVYSFCYAHDSGYMVDPNGKIFPCILAVGRDELAIGTYYPKVEFKENSIRNRNIDTIVECRDCTYSLLCGGGCAVRLNDYTDVFKPVCASIYNQMHELLPTLINVAAKKGAI